MPTQPKMYIPPDSKEDAEDDDESLKKKIGRPPSQAGREAEEIGNGTDLPKSRRRPGRPEVVPAPDTGNPVRPNPGSPNYNLNRRPRL